MLAHGRNDEGIIGQQLPPDSSAPGPSATPTSSVTLKKASRPAASGTMMTLVFGGSVMAICRSVWLSSMVVLAVTISPCQATVKLPIQASRPVDIIAHRGASFDAPENTVTSIKLGHMNRPLQGR